MLFLGAQLLVLRRDFAPGLVWPGMLDFPGGGREAGESQVACALRETREEVGLVLRPEDLKLAHLRDALGRRSWFFAAHLPEAREQEVIWGGEGQGWLLMKPQDFVDNPQAIPHFRAILNGYLQRLHGKGPDGQHPSGQ